MPIPIQFYEYTYGCNTKLQQPGYYDFSALAFLGYTKHLHWETFGWNFSNCSVKYILSPCLTLISEKKLNVFRWVEEKMKSCQIKSSWNSLCQKNNPDLKNWRSCWFWLLQQAFMKDPLEMLEIGVYYNWNDWPIQNMTLLTSIWKSLCHIAFADL